MLEKVGGTSPRQMNFCVLAEICRAVGADTDLGRQGWDKVGRQAG